MTDNPLEITWNPWHGCRKISAGCENCYVYRIDARYERNSREVTRNRDFDLPLRKTRTGEYKIPPGTLVYTCFTSDLLLDEADEWRGEIWEMMRIRSDLRFLFITKRIHRLVAALPADWGDGYENVHICCTVENQDRADFRLPIFRDAPIRRKGIVCEPLLGPVVLSPYLGPWVVQVLAGGESGQNARVCDYDWVLSLHRQCQTFGVPFHYKQTGARLRKDGKLYHIPRKLQHSQARRAGIDLPGVEERLR